MKSRNHEISLFPLDIFRECSLINNCPADLKNGTSFYYMNGQAWGFEGRPKVRNERRTACQNTKETSFYRIFRISIKSTIHIISITTINNL
jgi:hypothetical protein